MRRVADDECETFVHKAVAPTTAQAIQRAREQKGWSQKELATRINERPSVVHQYESKQAMPNNQVFAKMERVLGVRLRGKNVGDPFPERKSKKK